MNESNLPPDHDGAPERVTMLQVATEQAGQRVDSYAARQMDGLSRSHVQQLISNGHLTVNQQAVRASYLVQPGDDIVVRQPPAQAVGLHAEAIPLDIVYEDRDVVVVNKPAGMVVHPAPGHSSGTLVNALLARYPDMQISDELRPGIVHRIDRGTSGLLVVARNDNAMQLLADQQRERRMHKAYIAVVEGRMKDEAGVIDAPLARHSVDRMRQAVVAGGRTARTHYRVLEVIGDYTLLELVLETGRTHQIRVHLQHLGYPVLGDPVYKPRKRRPRFGLEAQFLHATKLGFFLPSNGAWREFAAPLPGNLEHVLTKLRNIVQQ